jgi:hypothetical protein
MSSKIRTITPLATGANTSRPPSATLESIVLKKGGLEKVQRAIQENMVAGKKPSIAAIQTALGSIIS